MAVLRTDSEGSGEDGRAFLQRRVAVFWTVMCVLSAISLGLSLSGLLTAPSWEGLFILVDTVQSGLLAWLLWRGVRSKRFIRTAEAGGLLLSTTLSALMGRFVAASLVLERGLEGAAADYAVESSTTLIMAGNLMLLALRAAIVPTQPRRTLLLTASVGAPIVLTPMFVEVEGGGLALRTWTETAAEFATTSFVFWCFAVAVCTVISHVIYGLRQEVREAQRLGQYVLEGKLGAGGMGEVYRARHGMMRRPTAIKLVRAEHTGEQGLARFEREVQLSARLTHPNTITLFDYGRTTDGVFYYAMELLEGCTLSRAVHVAGPMPARRVVHVLRQACGALREAHGVGLIHRDIKPENLMLCAQGGEYDVLKLLDFGLVKEMAVEGDAALTGANRIAGTPRYLAPESIREPESVDARADLYSLGAVAYFMLSGTHVFEGKTVVELCAAHLERAPAPLRERGVDVPASLEQVVLRCLEKDPADRPADAESLRSALESCGLPPWTAEDAETWWREYAPDLDEPAPIEATARTLTVAGRIRPLKSWRR